MKKRKIRPSSGPLQLQDKKNWTVEKRDNISKREGMWNEGMVFLFSCLSVFFYLYGLLKNYCIRWEWEYNVVWTDGILWIALITALVFQAGRYWKTVIYIEPVLLGFYVYRRWASLYEWGKELVNPYLLSWNRYHDTNIVPYRVAEGAKTEIVIYIIACALGWLFLYGMTRGRKIIASIPAIGMLCIGLIVGYGPTYEGVIFCGIGMLPAMLGMYRCPDRYGKRDIRSTMYYGVVLALTVVITGGLYRAIGGHTWENLAGHHEQIQAFQHGLERQGMELVKNVSGGLDNGDVIASDGDITSRKLGQTGQKIMTITVDRKPYAKMYLRGFIGGNYSHGEWKKLDEAGDFSTEEGTLNFDKENEFLVQKLAYLHALFGVADLAETLSTSMNVQIDYESVCETSAYVPYFTHMEGIDWSRVYWGEAGLCQKLPGVNHLEYEVIDLRKDETSDSLPYLSEEEYEMMWAYEDYVRQVYLHVPIEEVPRLHGLAMEWVKDGYQKSDEEESDALYVWKVKSELAGRAEYHTEPGGLPKGEDVVEHFLFESKKGFCIHYASAGTLLLREIGIPARYVTGYAVEPEMFVANGDGTYTAEVTDECGHAWTEIFAYNHHGWIPVEMTEGMNSMDYGMGAEELRLAKESHKIEPESESERLQPQQNREPETQKQPPQNQEQTDKGQQQNTMDRRFEMLRNVVLLLIILLVGGMAMGIGYGRILKKRRLYSSNTKVAVREVAHQLTLLCHRRRWVKTHAKTDEAFIQELVQHLPPDYEEGIIRLFQLFARNEFSEYIPTKNEAEKARKLFHQLKKLER